MDAENQNKATVPKNSVNLSGAGTVTRTLVDLGRRRNPGYAQMRE